MTHTPGDMSAFVHLDREQLLKNLDLALGQRDRLRAKLVEQEAQALATYAGYDRDLATVRAELARMKLEEARRLTGEPTQVDAEEAGP